jgi:hypothetical protein
MQILPNKLHNKFRYLISLIKFCETQRKSIIITIKFKTKKFISFVA